jgi:Yip1 domain
MSASYSALVRLPVRPIEESRILKRSPRWLVPFLILAAASVIILVFAYPDTVRRAVDHLPPSAGAGDRQRAAELLDGELLQRSVFLPLRLIAGWWIFAFLLYQSARAFRPAEGIRLAQFLSLEIHAEGVLVLSSLVIALGVPLPSLALLFPPSSGFLLRTLLATINLFTLWYILVLTAGVSVLCGYSKRKAFLIVAGVWVISTSLNLGVLNQLSVVFHLAV